MTDYIREPDDNLELDKEEMVFFRKNMENKLGRKSYKSGSKISLRQKKAFRFIFILFIYLFVLYLIHYFHSGNSKTHKNNENKNDNLLKTQIKIKKQNYEQENLSNIKKENPQSTPINTENTNNKEQPKKDILQKLIKKHNLRTQNLNNNTNNNDTQILNNTQTDTKIKSIISKYKKIYQNTTQNITLNTTNNTTSLIPFKKKIFVKYVDFWTPFELHKFDVHYLWSEKYDVVFSDNPQYVAYSCFGSSHRRYKNAIKLFISLERVRPNFDECDYAIGSYDITTAGDRYMRKPWFFPLISKYETIYNISKYWEEKGVINATEKKFCAWVVSNGGCSTRNNFFNMLSKYARVDSGGSYMNNVGGRVNNKMEFLAHYKFSICFENSKENGYGTEKLPQAFNSGTIPIYWGDDSMLDIYNNRSYIHIKDESQFQEKIQYIMEIHRNDTLYNEIIHQDIYKDKVKQQKLNDTYNKFIKDIVDQDFDKARRVGRSMNYSINRGFNK